MDLLKLLFVDLFSVLVVHTPRFDNRTFSPRPALPLSPLQSAQTPSLPARTEWHLGSNAVKWPPRAQNPLTPVQNYRSLKSVRSNRMDNVPWICDACGVKHKFSANGFGRAAIVCPTCGVRWPTIREAFTELHWHVRAGVIICSIATYFVPILFFVIGNSTFLSGPPGAIAALVGFGPLVSVVTFILLFGVARKLPMAQSLSSCSNGDESLCQCCKRRHSNKSYLFYFGKFLEQTESQTTRTTEYSVGGSRRIPVCDYCIFKSWLFRVFVLAVAATIMCSVTVFMLIAIPRQGPGAIFGYLFLPVAGVSAILVFLAARRYFDNKQSAGTSCAIQCQADQLRADGYDTFWYPSEYHELKSKLLLPDSFL